MKQVVDTDTAREFMRETLDKVAAEELAAICSEVEEKARWFQTHLSAEGIEKMSSANFFSLLRRVFATRRRADKIMEQIPLNQLKAWTRELLYGDQPLKERFQTFVDRFDGLDVRLRCDLASEILHFSDPDKYWLWTRWMWDPKVKTGALPLVTYSSFNLEGETVGDIYMRVGEAVAFVHEVGKAASFQTIRKSIFGTDVYLSCVYVIYVYTVLRMRMTQEFNKVVPDLPEFSRRLLGVYQGAKTETKAASDASSV